MAAGKRVVNAKSDTWLQIHGPNCGGIKYGSDSLQKCEKTSLEPKKTVFITVGVNGGENFVIGSNVVHITQTLLIYVFF